MHELVKSIQDDRAHVKERLLVLDKDHPRFSQPDGVVSFRDPAAEEPEPPPPELRDEQPATDNSDADDKQVWSSFNSDVVTKSAWTAEQIDGISLTRTPDPIDLSYQAISVRVVVASGISPMLEIEVGERATTEISKCLKACLEHTTTYTYESTSVRHEVATGPANTTATSSRPDPTAPLEWNATKHYVEGT